MSPECNTCKHFKYETGYFIIEEELEGLHTFICDAFPNGIPDEISYRAHSHKTPHPGDNGIQYENDPDKQIKWDEFFNSLSDDAQKKWLQGRII